MTNLITILTLITLALNIFLIFRIKKLKNNVSQDYVMNEIQHITNTLYKLRNKQQTIDDVLKSVCKEVETNYQTLLSHNRILSKNFTPKKGNLKRKRKDKTNDNHSNDNLTPGRNVVSGIKDN